jgi:hypothetical protein
VRDRHKHQAISFRPPEGDRAWLESYAGETGRPVRAILAEALAAYRAAAGGATPVASSAASYSKTAGKLEVGMTGITRTTEGVEAVSDDRAAFYAARLDDDEVAAKAVRPDQDYADSAHQERWSPARVLREVEAGRKLLAACDEAVNGPDADLGVADALEAVIRDRAAVYSDHPGYRQEWKP